MVSSNEVVIFYI